MTKVRSELARTARSIVRDFGQRMTLIKSSSGSYDVDTGINTRTTTEYCVMVAFARDQKSEAASLTRSEQRRAYVAAPVDCLTLDTSDVIRCSGVDYKISVIHETFAGLEGGLMYVCTLQG